MMTAADYPVALPPRHPLLEYRIERVLGHGGFGITYLAADTTLRKNVAIKEYLPAQFAVRAEGATVMPRTRRLAEDYRWGLERFLDEARTLARFRHANIVPVLRFFEANGTAYIVMEHEDGRPLAELLAGPGRLPPARVRALLEGVMDGLVQVHGAGFLHRDIKPSNIIVRADGAPVLIDFGAARQALLRGGATLTSIVTPRYAPLEQYQADAEQGPWTDIYALAAVVYQAITGEPPPEAPGRIRKDPCRKLAEADLAGYGATFLEAIDHALAVHPEERPQTVAAWRQSMGAPPTESVLLKGLADPTPAAAHTRLMQTPLTQVLPVPRARDDRPPVAGLRLGGADEADRVRLASPPRRSGRAPVFAAVAVVALLGAGGLYAWQARLLGIGDSRTADAQRPTTAPTPPPTVAAPPPAPKTAEAPPPAASKPPSPVGRPEPKGGEPKGGDPVPVKPPAPEQPQGKVGSIDELLGKGEPTPTASTAAKVTRDKTVEASRQIVARAQAAAEQAERARQRALERAGEARIRAAEAGKPDLPGAERVSFDDGSRYLGQLAGGQRGGLGVAELRAGERQAGEWKEDHLEGLGVLRADNGRGYEGEWRNGLPDGAGIFRLGSDERYVGQVKAGQPQGPGVRVLGDGRDTTTRAGIWQNGVLEGPGIETVTSGWRYEGAFHAGKRHGPGTLIAPDGARFHGTFVDGVADGYGVSVAPDGRVSSGDWRAGKLVRAEE